MVISSTKCNKCNVRICKNRPQLKCSLCEQIKHFKCNGLTKREAFEIIESRPDWVCRDCIFEILPVNGVQDIPRVSLDQCYACTRKISAFTVVEKCSLCDKKCHKLCINGSLGCQKCCFSRF